jgi:hypothetical protein
MISRLNSSASPLAFVSVLLAMSLAWLHAAAAADRALSIPVQITHAKNFDPFPSPDGKKLVFISMLSRRGTIIYHERRRLQRRPAHP